MKQAQALHVMMSGQNVFLTGPPGAGKTYVLNKFIKLAEQTGKKVAVTASTGIAATHIGGSTIHSWSGLGIKARLNTGELKALSSSGKLTKRYNSADILVIDEVSMLDGARLDTLNQLAKVLRRSDNVFGGLQVILVGDLFQLPPVSRESEEIDFAHTSAAWQELDPKICYISEQHRQSGADGLLEFLVAMRSGELEDVHQEMISERLGALPPDSTPVTRLYAHNMDVDSINQDHLARIDTEVEEYEAQSKGRAAKVEQLKKSILAPEVLQLKEGAEVMFVANNFAAGFVNGSRGRVTGFSDGWPMVRLGGSKKTIKVEPHTWSLVEDERMVAEVAQLPLRLAWAITIHKSQGMSLDAAEIDLGRSFTPGMGYVALSRVRSLDGIYLKGINRMALTLHPDIYEFDKQLRRASESLAVITDEWVDLPAEDETKTTSSTQKPDKLLLDSLIQWRLDRSQADNVPAYIVAHNTVLEALATRKPQTESQLLGISGFGPAKLAKYGPEILKIISTQ